MSSAPTRLVLASTSRYRKGLMERLGIPFDTIGSGVDETNPGLDPDALALHLAIEKARAVAQSEATPGTLVVGSDQVVDLDGDVLGKPGTVDRAAAQLERLAGRSHRLVTALAVVDHEGRCETAVDVHVLTMRDLSPATLRRYVETDQPLDCCGAYMLDRRGIALFERIEADPETADDTAIIGLPMMKLLAVLRRFGVDVLDF